MRTSRSLTVFRSLLLPGGVYLPGPGGVYLPGPGGGCVPAWSWGGCLVLGGCTWSGGVPAWSRGGVPAWSQGGVPAWSRGGRAWSGTSPPPVNRMTHRCKNITLAKTSFRPVTIHTKKEGWITFLLGVRDSGLVKIGKDNLDIPAVIQT